MIALEPGETGGIIDRARLIRLLPCGEMAVDADEIGGERGAGRAVGSRSPAREDQFMPPESLIRVGRKAWWLSPGMRENPENLRQRGRRRPTGGIDPRCATGQSGPDEEEESEGKRHGPGGRKK